MDEGRESQELAIPGKIVKSERKGSIAQTVRNILRKPASQAITKAPIEQAPIEQTPDEMSVERAKKILELIAALDEHGFDMHERHLSPAEQLKRFGGIHYKDIKKAFGVYTDHLITTHGAKEPHEHYMYRLLKEDLPGPPENIYGELQKRYYDLELAIMLDFKTPKTVRLTLHDGKRHGMVFPHDRGMIRVQSQIPLVDVKPDSSDERAIGFSDDLSLSRPIHPGFNAKMPIHASLFGLRIQSKNTYNPERFHHEYKELHQGMRWAAANLLCWDENRIVYPDDLDKSPSPLDKWEAQLNKPKLDLPPSNNI